MKFKGRTSFFKITALFVVILFLQSDFRIIAENLMFQNEIDSSVLLFKEGRYDDLINKSEKLLSEIGDEHVVTRGKLFLLLGAAYEMSGDKDRAIENYLLGDLLLDKPEIEGVDLKKLKVFNSTIYGKVIDGKRVFEKVGKRKKKKRFPILAIVGAAAVVVAVLILFKKKVKEDPGDLKKIYAQEVMSDIEWIEIPSGEFLMGDSIGSGEPHERPVHPVYLNGYRISKYEITLAQYAKYDEVNPLDSPSFFGSGENHPVVSVNYHEAQLFCEWLTEETNAIFVVPTEAQWEKAARGTDQRIYPWGNREPDCSIVNFVECVAGTSDVKAYPQDISFYGVIGMGGNVSEWVSDEYQVDYYSISPYSNPSGPDSSRSGYRILRGGNYASGDCRTTNRQVLSRHSSKSYSGFRIVMK